MYGNVLCRPIFVLVVQRRLSVARRHRHDPHHYHRTPTPTHTPSLPLSLLLSRPGLDTPPPSPISTRYRLIMRPRRGDLGPLEVAEPRRWGNARGEWGAREKYAHPRAASPMRWAALGTRIARGAERVGEEGARSACAFGAVASCGTCGMSPKSVRRFVDPVPAHVATPTSSDRDA